MPRTMWQALAGYLGSNTTASPGEEGETIFIDTIWPHAFRGLCGSQMSFSSNLFVQQTGDYQLHHLLFSGSHGGEAAAEIAHLHFAIQRHTATFEALADCTQQDVIAIERYTSLAKEQAASQQDLDKCVHNNHPGPSGVAQPVRLRVPLLA
jgi:hypothetical protein